MFNLKASYPYQPEINQVAFDLISGTIKNKKDIKNNRDHLNSLKNKSPLEWREYATQCMIEIMSNKGQQ